MEAKSSDWLRGPSGPTVCRCCFAEGCYKDISTEYFWMGKREVYDEMLTQTFDINITFGRSTGPNSNSRLICEPCISRLRDAAEFKRQVQECERMFLDYLDPGSAAPLGLEDTPDTAQKDVKDVQVNVVQVKEEKGNSDDGFADRGGFDDDDDDDDLDDQPLTRLATKVPKKESVDLFDLLDNAKGAKRKSTTKSKSSPAKKAKTKKETPKATTSKPKPEKKKKELVGASVEAAQRNARLILTYSTAYPFRYSMPSMQVECCLCVDSFDDPGLFRDHMDSKHASDDKSRILAKKICGGSTRVDITNLRCKICVTNFTTIDTLVSHLKSIHRLNIDVNHHGHGLVPLRLERNHFQCLICSKPFTGLKQLWRHSGSHFSKYVCDICGKNFETTSGLRLHSKYSHSSSEICKHCKKTFPTAEARKEHVKTTKACQPSICHICKERFLHSELKEKHLVSVHGKEKKTFSCTECDKVFRYRTLLYVHFKTTHTSENKCLYCGKQFPTKPSLQEHTSRHHTGERPFGCNVCEKTFVDKQSLQRHLITHDDSKKFGCPVCKRLYVRNYKLKLHMAKHHPNIEKT